VPTAVCDGITTSYEVTGSGPPLLMFSPGGFSAALANWDSLGIYRRLRLPERLASGYTCITFDRREAGGSGGRVERVGWADYAAQGAGLLDHLGIGAAHLLGGCAGCSTAAAFAAARPERALSVTAFWPAGGVKYRLRQQERFAGHLAYAAEHGPAGVAGLAARTGQAFTQDARVGPWASVIAGDPEFAAGFARLDAARYQLVVSGMGRSLFDRDTVPGAEPEDLLRLDVPALVVPGSDDSHATSAARYLAECLPRAEYWDVPVSGQTGETVPTRAREFLDRVSSG
jgi:pimeloyl-ACP methyl ester carboxylesterase